MTVKELKEALASLPDETEVVLQKDRGGNAYSPLEGADPEAVYIPETAWSGKVYSTNWSSEDALMPDKEWEEIKSRPRILVLYPVN